MNINEYVAIYRCIPAINKENVLKKSYYVFYFFYRISDTCLQPINVKHWMNIFECQIAKLIMSYSLPQVGGHGGPVDMCWCCKSGAGAYFITDHNLILMSE